MNIVEAYIKFKGQLLIFISGLPGCGKLSLAKNICRDFKIKIIDQFDYHKKGYDIETNLSDGTQVVNWYSDEAIDWDRMNEDIEKFKKDGLIVVGFSLVENKITSAPDYHVHLNIAKQLCMDRRKEFLEKHKDKEEYKEEYKLVDTQTEKLIMNKLIYPYYLESIPKSKINKFINLNNTDDDQVYDIAFEALIDVINKFLQAKDKPINDVTKTPKVTDVTKTDSLDTISASFELLEKPIYSYDDELDMLNKYNDEEDDGQIKFVSLDE